jgi:two-component system OmpR family sensor kinase
VSAVDRLSLLAHELRSPIAALTAIEETLRRLGPDLPASERRRMLELAVTAGRDIERLLIDPELLSLRRERIEVETLVSGLSGPDVEVAVTGRPVVEGDPTRLRQALANLVANGLRHGTHVRVEAAEDGAAVVIDVSDDGPGPPGELDVFARGASGAGSTGYGLWLARAIAAAHGGTLELVSRPGAGARFRLALPSAAARG